MKVRYIRMTITVRMTSSTGDYVQLSEINLLDTNGNRFNWDGANATVETSLTPQSGQEGNKLLDNNTSTKYCAAWSTAGCVITIDVPTYVDLDIYKSWNWYTADDYSSRDPKTFTLSVSRDGKHFTTVDSVSNMNTTTTRQALAYTGNIAINYKLLDTYEYEYTGSVQQDTLQAGIYRLKVYGAQGGYCSVEANAGKGGYAEGILKLTSSTSIYIYVGGSGNNGGFNGGGLRSDDLPGGGGGSDIRIGTDSLYARVIVAGGGGSDGAANRLGGDGGGQTGANTPNYGTGGYGGTQTGNNGGSSWVVSSQSSGTSVQADCYAGFGFGGNGVTRPYGRGGAGGGGWYGGTGTYPNTSDDAKGGGGGSGYAYTYTLSANYPSGCLLTNDHLLSNAILTQGVREGDGYIEIEKLAEITEKMLLTDGSDNVYTVGTIASYKDIREIPWNGEIYDKFYISYANSTTISYSSSYTNYKYLMLGVEPNKKYRVRITSTKSTLNRSFVRMLGSNASIPLSGTSSYTGRIPFTDVSSFTSPFEFTVETSATEYYIYIYFAHNVSGIVASDVDVTCYEIVDDIVTPTIVSGVTANNITKAFMQQYGQDPVYVLAHNLDISQITNPKVYRWNDTNSVDISSKTIAIPNAQVLSDGSFNLADETILGIVGIDGVYNTPLSIQYSYDDLTWTNKMTIASFIADKDNIYNGLGASKILYVRIWLDDQQSTFTKLRINCTNPED